MVTDVPKLQPPSQEKLGNDFNYSAAYVEEARKSYPLIGYDSGPAKEYRRMISEFYDYVKKNGTPAGQPEAKIAIAKGNLDLGASASGFNPNAAVGSYVLADRNPAWFAGQPERGWDIAYNVFFPRRNITGKYYNRYISGTPFGQADIVSFAGKITAEFLLKNYKLLVFMGWNTCSEEQYKVLTDYVKGGGTLFLSIPHLSTDDTRNYTNFQVSDLVRNGDFSELRRADQRTRKAHLLGDLRG